MSAWPLGGGVVVSDDGIAYTAAGSTATDGAVAAAVDIATGKLRWRQAYTLDRSEPKLSFGVQGNLLLKDSTLYINGGAPVGIVALDAQTGGNPRIAARLEAGREMFLEPDGKPIVQRPRVVLPRAGPDDDLQASSGPRVFPDCPAGTSPWSTAACSAARDPQALDRIVDLMNTDPKTGGKMGGGTVPWDVMQVPANDSLLWAGNTADVCGLAVASDGLVVLHADRVEGISAEGRSLWTVPLPAAPMRWGVALTGKQSVMTLADGNVICLTEGVETGRN